MKLKKHEAWHIVKSAFPEYTGRTFRLSTTGHLLFHDLNWGGGTRNQYYAVPLAKDGMANALPSAPPWNNPIEGKIIDIPQGWVVCEHSIFCGKDTGITIHANPQDLIEMLPNGIDQSQECCRT